ncbi:hypothetical protein [Pseudoalteromonas atlantica]|uniref:hypothetical protein n=1 Tax=Pseudoalteromonas atlantica TaxID=288 RepID=UPI0037361389
MPKIEVSKDMNDILRGIWHDRLSPKGIIFTYLCAKAFNVVRYPSTPDRSLDGIDIANEELTTLINSYGVEKISLLVKEVIEIKKQTKALLQKKYHNNFVTLQRALSPLNDSQYQTALRACDRPELFPMLVIASQEADIASFKIDVDIVSGWSTSSSNRYGSLHIEKDWHIDDIIIVSDYICSSNGGSGALESNEWLCLNRNENGLMEFVTSKCLVNDAPQYLYNKVENTLNTKGYEYLKMECLKMSSARIVNPRVIPNINIPREELSFKEKFKILFGIK